MDRLTKRIDDFDGIDSIVINRKSDPDGLYNIKDLFYLKDESVLYSIVKKLAEYEDMEEQTNGKI